jgi:hypothetical protein
LTSATPQTRPITITDQHGGRWAWAMAGSSGGGTVTRVFRPNDAVPRSHLNAAIDAFESKLDELRKET